MVNIKKETWYKILYHPVKWFLDLYFNKISYDTKAIEGFKPPFFLMGTHINNMDPLIAMVGIRRSVNFVTSDEYFRIGLLRWFLEQQGAISKTKWVSDMAIVRKFFKIRDSGGIIALFPEGQRNYTGTTGPIVPSTAGVIKSLKIPVVGLKINGAYSTLPRWGKAQRRGRVSVTYFVAITEDEVKSLSVEEINDKLIKSISLNEHEWQKTNKVPFRSKAPAERLELILYYCPKCNAFETLVSNKDIFKCTVCNYAVRIDEFGFLNKVNDDIIFDNLDKWREFCKNSLYSYIDSKLSDEQIIRRDNLTLFVEKSKRGTMKKVGNGTFTASKNALTFTTDKDSLRFDMNQVLGFITKKRNHISFLFEGKRYAIAPKGLRYSGLLLEDMVTYIKKTNTLNKE